MRPFKKNLTGIDLLPESVQAPKRFRKRIIKLAAVQAAIVLCIVLSAMALNALEQRAWDESLRLTMQVNALRHDLAVTVAAYTQDIVRRISAEEAFIEANAVDDFNPQWITAIISADAGNMIMLDYSHGFIMLTGMTDDMNNIEIYRQNLLETEIFHYVRIGRTALQEGGSFFYELRMGIR